MRLIYFSKKKGSLIGGAGVGDMVALELSPFENNGYVMSSIFNIYSEKQLKDIQIQPHLYHPIH